MPMRIKELRTRKGLSVREAAKQLGLAPSTYHNYETGSAENHRQNIKKEALFGSLFDSGADRAFYKRLDAAGCSRFFDLGDDVRIGGVVQLDADSRGVLRVVPSLSDGGFSRHLLVFLLVFIGTCHHQAG